MHGKTTFVTYKGEELQQRAMDLWDQYAEKYRELIPRYFELLDQKRDLKISPLNKVKGSTIREIPKITFLEFKDEELASNYVLNSTINELSRVILDIEMMLNSYAWKTITAHIYDFEYEIRHHGSFKMSGLKEIRQPKIWAKTPKGISSDN